MIAGCATRSTWPRFLCLGLVLAISRVIPASGQEGPSPDLAVASSADHLWFATRPESADGPLRLYHHAPHPDGAFAQPFITLPRRPEAMAAWGSAVWIVFAPPEGESREREVYTIRAERDPFGGFYFAVPADRLEMLASLPGDEDLLGLTATPQGPVALTGPADRPRLQEWRGGRWEEADLPDGIEAGTACRLSVAGEGGDRLVLIAGDRAGSSLHTRDSEGTWSSAEAPVAASAIRRLTRMGGRLTAILEPDGGEAIRVVYLRPTQILALAAFEPPAPPEAWSATGMRDGVLIVSHQPGEVAAIARIDPLSGVVGERRELSPPPVDTLGLLRLPVLFALTVVGLVLVVTLRPAERAAIVLPEGRRPLAPFPRFGAFLIDLAPGAVAAMVILRCGITDLLGLPMMTVTFDESVPYLVMASIGMAHSVVTEIFAGTTLGKLVVRARVVTVYGARPTRRRLALRNLVKCLIVVVPPLAIITLLNPNLQGLDDLVGRTVVVGPPPDPEDAPTGDA